MKIGKINYILYNYEIISNYLNDFNLFYIDLKARTAFLSILKSDGYTKKHLINSKL